MQRRVGQHDSEFVVFWSGLGKFDSRWCEYDWTRDRCQQGFRFGRKFDQGVSRSDFLRHESEGLFFTVFALAQSRYCCWVPRAACQVIAAESFYCENCAGMKKLGRPADAAGFITFTYTFV